MTHAPPISGTTTQWGAVLAAFGTGIVSGFYVGKMPSALPTLSSEFGLSLVMAGWVVSMFNMVGVAGAIGLGILSDRLGALRVASLGLAMLSLGGVIATIAPNGGVLLISRALESVGFISIIVSAPALILTATAPARRGLVLGLWSIYLPAGASVAIAIAPYLLGTVGWRGLWLAVVGLTGLVGLMLFLKRSAYASLRGGHRRSLRQIVVALRAPMPWLLGLAFSLYSAQQIALLGWMPTYLIQTRDLDPTDAAFATALFVFMNVLGCIGGGLLLHLDIRRGILFAATFAALAVISLAIFLAPWDGLRFGAALAFSFVAGVIPAASLSGSSRYAPSPAEAGIVQGLIVQIGNFGNLLGPPAMAAVVETAGRWDAAIHVLLVACACGIATGMATLALENRAAASAAAGRV